MAESVCEFLEQRGHVVIRSRSVIATDSTDPVVAKAAAQNDAILLSDDGDFKQLVKRRNKNRTMKRLSRVSLRCSAAQLLTRIGAVISLIEFEFGQAQARPDKRIIIEVHTSLIRILR